MKRDAPPASKPSLAERAETKQFGTLALRVDEVRLWRRHMALATFGRTARGGVNRQALSPEEIEARAALVSWGREIGLHPSVDGIGNLFLRLTGVDDTRPPILTGSHIDSQPTGGKFDGAFGVLAALEALQAIVEAGVRPPRSIELVAWTNEEGSRFAPGMMGSEAFSGARPLDEMLNIRDASGTTVAEALQSVFEAMPDIERRQTGFPVAAYIEAHIEQGPELEARGKPVGVVTGIQGSRRFRINVLGEESHAGTTPRHARKDSLSAAVAMIAALERAICDEEDIVKFTVGMFKVEPNAPSVVPGIVYFSIDLRHPVARTLTDLGDQIAPICAAHKGSCQVEVKEIAHAGPLDFPAPIQSVIREVAEGLGIDTMDILRWSQKIGQVAKVYSTG
mgnify:CR=1 FL=1